MADAAGQLDRVRGARDRLIGMTLVPLRPGEPGVAADARVLAEQPAVRRVALDLVQRQPAPAGV